MPPTNEPDSTNQTDRKHSMHLHLDLRLIVALLLLVIIGILVAWKPWHNSPQTSDRTITVTGEATLQAEADNFVFYPSYQFNNNDREAALKAMSTKSDEIVAKLKSLGVSDSNIKTNANGYDRGGYYPTIAPEEGGPKTSTYSLQLTVTTTSRDQAQKVQDYLASTNPSGAVTPNPTFSEQKRKSLESQARDTATKDARSKADQSAKNLGFKVGAVKSVNDGSGFNGSIQPLTMDGGKATNSSAESTGVSSAPALGLQPGKNPLSYSVTVVYYVK